MSEFVPDPATDEFTIAVSIMESRYHKPQRTVYLRITRDAWDRGHIDREMMPVALGAIKRLGPLT